MNWFNRLSLTALFLAALCPVPSLGQTLYRCVGADGVPSYQQTPCSDQTDARTIEVRPGPTAPPSPSRPEEPPALRSGRQATDGAPLISPMAESRPVAEEPSGFIRCVRPDGGYRIVKGTRCPVRHESAPQQAGMVTDVGTGQQRFMVPGGGNGMIDPATGQRHELISPPPTRQVQDQAQPVSRDQACRDAQAAMNRATSDQNRTIHTIRRAEEKYRALCG